MIFAPPGPRSFPIFFVSDKLKNFFKKYQRLKKKINLKDQQSQYIYFL